MSTQQIITNISEKIENRNKLREFMGYKVDAVKLDIIISDLYFMMLQTEQSTQSVAIIIFFVEIQNG